MSVSPTSRERTVSPASSEIGSTGPVATSDNNVSPAQEPKTSYVLITKNVISEGRDRSSR